MADKEIDLLGQFKVHTLSDVGGEGVPFDLTNVAFYGFLIAGLIWLFLYFATRKAAMVPNRLQSVGELFYEFVAKMIQDIIGPEGMRFLPLVFSLFTFVLVANFIGLVPGAFTITSHLSVTLLLGFITISTVIAYGLFKKGWGFFALFAPPGLPFLLYFLVVPIEIISFLVRPITLAVRLFGNMLAGHMVLKLFGYFVILLGSLGGGWVIGALLPLFGIFAVTGLEILVALLQAYVFTTLTVVYLNDVVNDHH